MPIGSFDISVAARAAADSIEAGVTPLPFVDAAKAAGFGPHDKWPHALFPAALAALVDTLHGPKDRKAWLAENVDAIATVDGDSRDALARWLVQVGDPAWDAVDAIAKPASVSEAIATARRHLAAQVAGAAFDAVVDAAQRAADHYAATKDDHAADDAERAQRWADDDVAPDLVVEEQRRVENRRNVARLRAMWAPPPVETSA